MAQPLILGIGGTMRAGSTSEQALTFCLAAARALGAETAMLSGADLDLPMYGKGLDARAARLVELMRACDGIVVASPAFHGGMSGMVKNALDHAEELRGGPRAYLDGIAFGAIACAAGWQAVGGTLAGLRATAHALRAWPTPMGAGINSLAQPFGPDGAADPAVAGQLEMVAAQVVGFARLQMAGRPAAIPVPLPRLAAVR